MHHVVCTIDGANIALYIDGAMTQSNPLSVTNGLFGDVTTFSQIGVVGANNDPEWLGQIHDFSIYDKALTAEEVLWLYQNTNPLTADPFTVTNTNDSGPGSLRQAILNAEAIAGRDVIRFNIPELGSHTIQPLSGLPEIFDPIVIDGTTQPGFAGKPIIELDGSKAMPLALFCGATSPPATWCKAILLAPTGAARFPWEIGAKA